MTNRTDTTAPPASPRPKRKHGLALLTPERIRELASKGGVRAHELGTAHEWTQEEAREAGRKGGRAVHAKRAAKKVG